MRYQGVSVSSMMMQDKPKKASTSRRKFSMVVIFFHVSKTALGGAAHTVSNYDAAFSSNYAKIFPYCTGITDSITRFFMERIRGLK